MKLACYSPSLNLGRVSDFGPWLRQPVAQLFEDILPVRVSNPHATALYEDADYYEARFELPGVKKEAVKVELHERLLTVTAERRFKNGTEESVSTLNRSLTLPDNIQEDAISAVLEDGILTLKLPKQEQRKPKQITVS